MDTRLTKRWDFPYKFKVAVALEALRGDKTGQEIAAKRQLHPTQVSTWKRQAFDGMPGVFSDKVKPAENKEGEIKDLHVPLPGKLFAAHPIAHAAVLFGLKDQPGKVSGMQPILRVIAAIAAVCVS